MSWRPIVSRVLGVPADRPQPTEAPREVFLRRIAGLENFVWLLNRMPTGLPPALEVSPPVAANDDALVRRVMAAYRHAVGGFEPSSGFWDMWHETIKKPIHDALAGDDGTRAAAVLRDPASNVFFWGFDAIASSPAGESEPHELVLRRLNKQKDWRELYAYWLCDCLVSLAEALGARRVVYPEMEVDMTLGARSQPFDVDAVLQHIEGVLGVTLSFPNPFANELGLRSRRGIVGFRSIQSLYQAWRIAQCAKGRPGFKVLEIGAGLGRTAYFAHLLGVRDYTIIDVPLTNAAQGYFLGRVLGPNAVQLGTEQQNAAIRIVRNADLERLPRDYDLIVNVDSWTEMADDVAGSYWRFAREATRKVLSINHEHNRLTVRDLYKDDSGVEVKRHPYPLRRGYVEEWITW